MIFGLGGWQCGYFHWMSETPCLVVTYPPGCRCFGTYLAPYHTLKSPRCPTRQFARSTISTLNDMSSTLPSTESQERSSAIRCLFPSTDSSQESQVPEDSQSEIENNAESQSSAAATVNVVEPISPDQQDGPSTCTPDVSPIVPSDETVTTDPAAYTPEEHPPADDEDDSVLDTSCSQAIEETDDANDPDVMEHDEFKELIVRQSVQRRIVRNSARPTLWRHQRRPMASLCAFDAVDDGVCIVATGVLWSIDGRMYEIVLVCTLGWVDPKCKKSHQVGFNQPIYVLLRDAGMQGQEIKFVQLHRCLAAVIFREGRPHSEVNFQDIGNAKKLVNIFIRDNARAFEAWGKINYLYTRNEIVQRQKEEAEVARRLQEKRDEVERKRQARLEREAKKREIATLKRQERQARIAAEKARNKTAKAEMARRKREIESAVRVVTSKACRKLEDTLQNQFAKAIETSRAELEADLGHRLAQIEEAVESNLVHRETFAKHQSNVDKRLKKLLSKVKKLGEDAEKVAACVGDENDNAPSAPKKRLKRTGSSWPRQEAMQALSVANYPCTTIMSPDMRMAARRLPMSPHPAVWRTAGMHPMSHGGHPQYMNSIFGQSEYTH